MAGANEFGDLCAAVRRWLSFGKRVQNRNQCRIRGGRLGSERIARDQTGERLAEGLAEPFIGEIEEGLVTHDRAAGASAKLVEVKGRFMWIQRVNRLPRIEHVIAEKLKNAAMQAI